MTKAFDEVDRPDDRATALADTLAVAARRRRRRRRPGRPRPARGLHRTPGPPLAASSSTTGIVSGDDYDGLVEQVGAELAATHSRAAAASSIVHGDYRLDNTVIGDDGEVRAILDWELCTLGDPMADVGRPHGLLERPADGPRRHSRRLGHHVDRDGDPAEVLVAATPTASGRDVSDVAFYTRVRLLEAGLHPPGRLRPLPGRGGGRRLGARRPVPGQIVAGWRTTAATSAGGALGREPLGTIRSTRSALHPDASTDPVLVVALEGWVDAGLGAATAVASLLATADDDDVVVTFDDDHFLDQRARRPVARIVNGVTTELTWPRDPDAVPARTCRATTCSSCSGPEPDFHWRGFVDAVVELARRFGVRMVVGLGAFPAPAPHTRPGEAGGDRPADLPGAGRPGRRSSSGELEVPAGVLGRSSSASATPASTRSRCGPGCRTTSRRCRSPTPVRRWSTGWPCSPGWPSTPPTLRRAADARGARSTRSSRRTPSTSRWCTSSRATLDASEGNPLGVDDAPLGRRDRGRARAVPARRGPVSPVDRSERRGGTHEGRRRDRLQRLRHPDAGAAGRGLRLRRRLERPRRATTRSCPLAVAAGATERIELGTSIAVAFARNPMNLAMIANDLQELSEGRFILGLGSQIKPHITKRFSMPWSHPAPRMRELILAIRAIWAAWADDSKLDFRGEFYTHTLMTPFFNPGPEPLRQPHDPPRRGRRAHDRGGGRGGRRDASSTGSPPSGTCAR